MVEDRARVESCVLSKKALPPRQPNSPAHLPITLTATVNDTSLFHLFPTSFCTIYVNMGRDIPVVLGDDTKMDLWLGLSLRQK